MLIVNGIDLSGLVRVGLNIRGRGIMGQENTIISPPVMEGGYLSATKRHGRLLEVPITIYGTNQEEIIGKVDQLNALLDFKEPKPIILPGEPNRIYYGLLDGEQDWNNLGTLGRGVLYFYCPDPYKYGTETTAVFPSDSVSLTNDGTAEAEPIFEFEVTEPVTFAMIQKGEDTGEYQMIGIPADDDVEVVDTRTSVLYENGSTIDTWSPASIDMVDVNVDSVDGVMGTDGAGIRPENYGTPREQQRGPAVFKELPNAIQNFEIQSTFDIISRREIENFRMGIYFHDENLNNLGHLGLKDNSRNHKRRVPLGRVGHYRGGGLANGNLIGDADSFDNARETTLFYLRVKREGQKFSFYIGEWQNQRHIRHWEGTYQDVNNEWQGRLKYITLFIGSYQDRVIPARLRMNSVEVFELSQVTEDHTPYIAYPGDIITFDHKLDELLINGEDRTDIKDLGGQYFKLDKGSNELYVLPDNSFNTSCKFRRRYR
ncbi:hypothetical protein JCM9152_3986 [Halalkalibacter hemicellulosilyticusJCM 9152]|uniref:Phage tail protein n=1 Tax=Halalkalibacter hemicellulosilyticusJCM 9152 TaxID=1236971 RepID=W4QK57_9BACI|nr:hypothetical protein JCM9152_3986 [Halalkalibacter hemicellulosilyticusJCM 9152]